MSVSKQALSEQKLKTDFNFLLLTRFLRNVSVIFMKFNNILLISLCAFKLLKT